MQAKGKERDNKIQKDFNEWGTFNIYHAPLPYTVSCICKSVAFIG